MPSRPLFSYQILLSYAVLQVFIVDRWMQTRRLKSVNLIDLFDWFERQHSTDVLKDTVITINMKTSVLSIYSCEDYRLSQEVINLDVAAVYLKSVQERLVVRFEENRF